MRGRAPGLAAATTALLYVHYLPGLALAGAVAIASCWRALREKSSFPLRGLATVGGVAVLLYAPWLATLWAAAG